MPLCHRRFRCKIITMSNTATDRQSPPEKTIICLKWGHVYGPEYVNRLLRGVSGALTPPFRFVCFTDNPAGIDPAVEVRDIQSLTFTPTLSRIWWKLAVSHPGAGLSGRCLFLDLDIIVCAGLDDFFSLPGRFCIIRNWIERRKRIFRPRPKIGNSSVFRFDAGEWSGIVEQFLQDPRAAKENFPTEQAFMTHAVGLKNIVWWPEEWVRSYKFHCHRIFPLNWVVPPKIPEGTRILAFHGHPKMPEVIAGFQDKWHKRALPMPEIAEFWK